MSEQKSNQDTSQLFKMAAPRKFENKIARFWNSFFSTIDTLLEKKKKKKKKKLKLKLLQILDPAV